jgi:hypothetical protein
MTWKKHGSKLGTRNYEEPLNMIAGSREEKFETWTSVMRGMRVRNARKRLVDLALFF